MSEYLVKLRYYPGDPWEEIREGDLKSLGQKHGVKISYEKIENREMKAGLLMENTLDKRIEDVTQEVITVSGDQEEKFSECIRRCIKSIGVRARRTVCWAAMRPARRLPSP